MIPQPLITEISLKITYLKFYLSLLEANELILVVLAINILRPSDIHMNQYIRPSSIQIMACHLISTKPFSEPMKTYHQLHPKEQSSVIFELKYNDLHM